MKREQRIKQALKQSKVNESHCPFCLGKGYLTWYPPTATMMPMRRLAKRVRVYTQECTCARGKDLHAFFTPKNPLRGSFKRI